MYILAPNALTALEDLAVKVIATAGIVGVAFVACVAVRHLAKPGKAMIVFIGGITVVAVIGTAALFVDIGETTIKDVLGNGSKVEQPKDKKAPPK